MAAGAYVSPVRGLPDGPASQSDALAYRKLMTCGVMSVHDRIRFPNFIPAHLSVRRHGGLCGGPDEV
jgi:hypothetical protein